MGKGDAERRLLLHSKGLSELGEEQLDTEGSSKPGRLEVVGRFESGHEATHGIAWSEVRWSGVLRLGVGDILSYRSSF